MERKPKVSPGELEILRYINERHPITVRDVAEHFARLDGRARTTVLTLMERLRKKGYLARQNRSGVNEYVPREPEAQVVEGLVRSFVQQVLGGSVAPLLQFLGTDAHLTDEEIAQLQRLANEMRPAPEEEKHDAER